MKIIEHGNTYNIISCPKCYAKISYVNKDIKKEDINEEIFGIQHYYHIEYIKCPECNQQINIYERGT